MKTPDIRQGVKEYANWPTIPQLYVKGEFVGGCDIVREMFQSGELAAVMTDAGVELKSKAWSLEAASSRAGARFRFADFEAGAIDGTRAKRRRWLSKPGAPDESAPSNVLVPNP